MDIHLTALSVLNFSQLEIGSIVREPKSGSTALVVSLLWKQQTVKYLFNLDGERIGHAYQLRSFDKCVVLAPSGQWDIVVDPKALKVLTAQSIVDFSVVIPDQGGKPFFVGVGLPGLNQSNNYWGLNGWGFELQGGAFYSADLVLADVTQVVTAVNPNGNVCVVVDLVTKVTEVSV